MSWRCLVNGQPPEPSTGGTPPPLPPPPAPPPAPPPPVPPHGHTKLTIGAITALVVALATLVSALTGAWQTTHHSIRSQAQVKLRADAVQANKRAAEVASNPACSPPAGQGKMGACAPLQALAAAQSLAIAAGDPDTITGHPLGVDTSNYQPCGYDMSRWAFLFFKAVESTHYKDGPNGNGACVRANVAEAKREHKAYGLYDFLRPGWSSPEAEADFYASVVRDVGATDMPFDPVADVEVTNGNSGRFVHDYACRWFRRVDQDLHRTAAIEYTGGWFINGSWSGDNCGGVTLWDSAYVSPPWVTPLPWRGHGGITFMQYSGDGAGPGPHFNGNWDSDAFLGSPALFRQLTHHAPPKDVATACREVLKLWARRDAQHGLHPYGQARLKKLYAQVKKTGWGCHLSGPAPLPAPPGPPPTLKRGDSGSDVAHLQRKLHITADGQFGPQTEAAVRSFQSKHHLTADGVVGPQTWKALG